MNDYAEKIEENLQDLLVKTYETELGFKQAASHADNTTLKYYFKLKAQERHGFLNELESKMKSIEIEKIKKNAALDSLDHAWINVQAIMSFSDEESMLEEAIKGEKAAIKDYSAIIGRAELSNRTKIILEAQRNKIERGLSSIKTLEELS